MTSWNTEGNIYYTLFQTSLLSFALILGVFGNLLVIVATIKCKKLQIPTNIFLCNLCTSDVLLMAIGVANFVADRGDHGRLQCRFLAPLLTVLLTANVLTLVVVALERNLVVLHPTKMAGKMNTTRSIMLSLFVNFIAILAGLFQFTAYTFGNNNRCGFNWSSRSQFAYVILMFLFQYIGPLALMSFLYLQIWHKIRSKNQKSIQMFNKNRRPIMSLQEEMLLESVNINGGLVNAPSIAAMTSKLYDRGRRISDVSGLSSKIHEGNLSRRRSRSLSSVHNEIERERLEKAAGSFYGTDDERSNAFKRNARKMSRNGSLRSINRRQTYLKTGTSKRNLMQVNDEWNRSSLHMEGSNMNLSRSPSLYMERNDTELNHQSNLYLNKSSIDIWRRSVNLDVRVSGNISRSGSTRSLRGELPGMNLTTRRHSSVSGFQQRPNVKRTVSSRSISRRQSGEFYRLRHSMTRMRRSVTSLIAGHDLEEAETADFTSTRYKQTMKTLKIFGALLMVFFMCMAPHHILELLRISHVEVNPCINIWFRLLIYINAALNPWLYGGMNTHFQLAFKKLFTFSKLHRVSTIMKQNMFNSTLEVRSLPRKNSLLFYILSKFQMKDNRDVNISIDSFKSFEESVNKRKISRLSKRSHASGISRDVYTEIPPCTPIIIVTSHDVDAASPFV